MGTWKIGYAEGLSAVASEAAGKALYDGWSVEALTLSTATTTTRLGGKVTAIAETRLTDTGNFTIDQFNGGFLKVMSGTAKGEVYKITDGTANYIDVTDSTGSAATMVTDGISVNDYYEVVTGSTTFEFPANRNPVRRDMKIVNKGIYKRFPLYSDQGGFAASLGREPEDFVILGYLTSEADLAELTILSNLKMDFASYDGSYTAHELAPLILEMGTNDADSQYLVHLMDIKKIRDGKRAGLIEIMMHFQQLGLPSYRGF